MKSKHIGFLGLLLVLGCAAQVKPDLAMSADAAQDDTIPIQGCGNQPITGYTYCRKTEGDNTAEALTLIGPPALCAEDSCVFFKIFYPSGEQAYELKLKRGETRVSIPWAILTKKDHFDLGDRGFWGIRGEVHWIDTDGNARVSFMNGEIRMRVLPKAYSDLHESPEDPNYVWTWLDQGRVFKMTSACRAYTGVANGSR